MKTAKLRKAILFMNNRCCCNLLLRLALDDIGWEKDNGNIEDLAEHFAEIAGKGRARPSAVRSAVGPGERNAVIEDGTFCGALAAAVAVLYSVKEYNEAADCQDELMDWFGASFGGYDCEAVAADSEVPKEALCPKVILATYLQLRNYVNPDNHLSQKTLI
jgi:hypothetical protein